jgi:hypothetical protein
MSDSPIQREALRLAALGYPVFPCAAGAKRPVTLHGVHDATIDPEQIRRWWEQHPTANLAVATTGMVVIDVDGADNPWLRDQPERASTMWSAPTAITPRGGRHHFFRALEGSDIRCSTGKVAKSVDVRANGGYIVASPSTFGGKQYTWSDGAGLERPIKELPEVPSWLLDAVQRPAGSDRPSRRLGGGRPAVIHEGERNATLTSLAGKLRRKGATEEELLAALRRGNAEMCQPSLPDAEIASIAASVALYPTGLGTDDSTAQVIIGPDEYRVVDEVITLLKRDDDLYRRGNVLVRLVVDPGHAGGSDRSKGGVRIDPVPRANLRERITRVASIQRVDKNGELVAAHPPGWLVLAVEARGEWPGVRDLVGVSATPFLRPDGTVCQTAGYDAATRVLYHPTAEFPAVNERPTEADARAAIAMLRDVVVDFRFEAEHHFSTWVASLLTPLARFAFSGCTPIFVVDANVRGAGKGLLVQVAGNILFGHDMAVASYSPEPEEMRKKITTFAMAGDQALLLDNVEGKFGNDAIDRASTSTRWKDRLLGSNTVVDVPMTTCWFITGNNILVAADTARRVMHIRLDVLEEHPENRTGFRHRNLLDHVRQHRAELLAGCLTILSAYMAAGRPRAGLSTLGSFEGWNLVREAIVWAGLADPCDGRKRLVQFSDSTAEVLQQLVSAWSSYDPSGQGLVIASVIAALYPPDKMNTPTDDTSVRMRAALELLVASAPGRAPTTRQVASRLAHYRRRVVAGQFLDFNAAEYNRAGAVWRLLRADGEGSSASLRLCESFSSPAQNSSQSRGGVVNDAGAAGDLVETGDPLWDPPALRA